MANMKQTVLSVDKEAGQQECFYWAGGNVNCYNNFGKLFGSSY